jgi:hypothetical protein
MLHADLTILARLARALARARAVHWPHSADAGSGCQDFSSRYDPRRGPRPCALGAVLAFLSGGPNRIVVRRPRAPLGCPGRTNPKQC